MNVLFDTQALVFWIAGVPLPKKVEVLVEEGVTIYVSTLAPWELLMKRQFRGIGFTMDHFWKAINEIGARLLTLEGIHVDTYAKLPVYEDHRDPFDRMLIAQAMSEDLTLISSDRRFREYEVPVIWN
jgi:PIN domain nuclease of toxin-antitoxin system